MLHLVDTEAPASARVVATHCPYCSLQCGLHLRAAVLVAAPEGLQSSVLVDAGFMEIA
jgi:hypothetical protein